MAQRKLNEEIIHCIIMSLIDLLKEKAFDDISIVEIIKHAGVSRNSFYRNFSSKEDILIRHIRMTTQEFVDSNVIPVLQVPWDTYIEGTLNHLYRHKDFLDLLERNGRLHLISDIVDDTIDRRTAGRLDAFHQAFLAGGIFNLYKRWAQNGYQPKPEDVAHAFRNQVLNI